MKRTLILLLAFSLCGCAGAQSQGENQALGAVVGGTLGYIFGDGSGHQKEIAAGGAVLGAILASDSEPRDSYRYDSREYYYSDYRAYQSYATRPFYGSAYNTTYSYRRYCRSTLPEKYHYNSGAAESWIRGCVEREAQRQQEFENRAYQEGYSQ